MSRKVAESNSVAYLSPSSAEMFGVEEGFYIVEDKESEISEHVNSDGEKYSVRHETNALPVRRVFPSANGEDGFVYEESENDDGGEE